MINVFFSTAGDTFTVTYTSGAFEDVSNRVIDDGTIMIIQNSSHCEEAISLLGAEQSHQLTRKTLAGVYKSAKNCQKTKTARSLKLSQNENSSTVAVRREKHLWTP